MHQTIILQNIRFYFILYYLSIVYFRRSFEVGDASQSCVGSGFANGQDDLENRRRLTGSTQAVLGIPNHPHLPEMEKFLPQNVAFLAMVPAGGW